MVVGAAAAAPASTASSTAAAAPRPARQRSSVRPSARGGVLLVAACALVACCALVGRVSAFAPRPPSWSLRALPSSSFQPGECVWGLEDRVEARRACGVLGEGGAARAHTITAID